MGIAFLFIGAIAYPKKDLLGPQRQCALCARVEAVNALHDALANVHDGRPLRAEHVILRLKQPPHGLGQREKARVALQSKVTRRVTHGRAAAQHGKFKPHMKRGARQP